MRNKLNDPINCETGELNRRNAQGCFDDLNDWKQAVVNEDTVLNFQQWLADLLNDED